MQIFDSGNELRGERHRGFKDHPAPGMPCSGRATVEAEPGGGVDKLPLTVDEVRHPECILTQIDRNFTPLAKTQELALNGGGESVRRIPVSASMLRR